MSPAARAATCTGSQRLGHPVTGIDRTPEAVQTAAALGEAIAADLENGPWPLPGRLFGGVVVTNYLWRPLLPTLVQSLAPGGVLLYETFASGNETVGRPARADFLLQPGELLTRLRQSASGGLRRWLSRHPRTLRAAHCRRACAAERRFTGTPSAAHALLVRMLFYRLPLRT